MVVIMNSRIEGLKCVLRKCGTMILTIFLVSFLVFASFEFISGDMATSMLGIQATEEAVEVLRLELGLNRPFLVRYIDWGFRFLQGDMGHSYAYNMSVTDLLQEKFPITITLTLLSFLFVLVLAIPFSILAAKIENRYFDHLLLVGNQVMMAIPPFFLGILITYVFGLVLRIFVPGGYVSYESNFIGYIGYLIFPAIALALPKSAMTMKLLRSSLTKEMEQDYVRTAYSKGSTKNRVLYQHVLPNALIPVITFLGMVVTEMMVGSMIVEQVFGIPGMGSILLHGISKRDYPLIQGIIVCFACLVVLVNALADLLCQRIDPRIRQRNIGGKKRV